MIEEILVELVGEGILTVLLLLLAAVLLLALCWLLWQIVLAVPRDTLDALLWSTFGVTCGLLAWLVARHGRRL